MEICKNTNCLFLECQNFGHLDRILARLLGYQLFQVSEPKDLREQAFLLLEFPDRRPPRWRKVSGAENPERQRVPKRNFTIDEG
ncbi:hypothetical protein J6590_105898 [Homalodisca vitripennis]|nr:hypothetical protein J6590_029424 [Homalodisca vitripennis]KAG8274526.1 hypothetical protein J6590_105898 [Homalodisca vitripennis]